MSNKTSRDIRQEQCITNWVKAKGHATCEGATGFGSICRSTKELVVLLLGKIGETPEMDNTEINSEFKESELSYSVEVETI